MKDSMDFDRLLAKYEFKAPYTIEQRESGMNNTTRMITAGADRYVLRIYNNHRDANIVRLEHEVLAELRRLKLPFQVPVPVQNKWGDTINISRDGTLSAMFHYIDGERPSSANEAHVLALGKAAARLTSALSEIKPERGPLYSPYYSLESTYSSMDETAFAAMADLGEGLAARSESFALLLGERRGLIEECEAISRLPKQWIHGDLVFNNTVAQGDDIVGVLDFEFCTVDVRAMELAVILVDLIKPDDPACGAKVKLLLKEYVRSFPLPAEECERLPALMKLRLLDVALHFAARLKDGLDEEHILCGIIDQSAFVCKWINENGEDLKI
ncbi:phosphotransferase [Paenibacillus alkaliterrae]|uniref:phosphotransferase n=1 Tax=Paenibacillus alkaliterrae TaxID=320909 RepID=UPI001F3D1681|nr:phosphotransferase [Paenibacillus alkaliterrae]MCF2938254.1 phosphotransferase [Paenibacillus alkaliterrae]